MLTKEDGAELLKLAKEAVKSYFKDNNLKIPEKTQKKFSQTTGVFVTITKKGQLRGCIGYIESNLPLWKAIANSARNAAFGDPRFPQVAEQELKDLDFEISVLTKPVQIDQKGNDLLKQIKIGKHGLIIEKNQYKGLLLPQVFTEFKVDTQSALEMTCEKAGLPSEAWKDKETKVYSFECQIFKE